MNESTFTNSYGDTLVLPQKNNLRKKLILISVYFSSIPVFIVFVMLVLLTVRYQGAYIVKQAHQPQYQAVPENAEKSSVEVVATDGREEALREFFASYNSPLEDYAGVIIAEADLQNIDYRLLPAIAMQESTLCKKAIEDSHNCWGYGIYGGKVTKFPDYPTAIRTVTSTLSNKYVKLGYDNPHEIVTKYTPSDDGKWVDTVNMIMTHLKESI